MRVICPAGKSLILYLFILVAVGKRLEFLCDFSKTYKEFRGENTAFAVNNHFRCLVFREGFFVAALTYQSIIDIRHGNKLGGNRNLIPF